MVTIRDIKMPVNCEECFARVLAWCRLDEEERIVVPAVPDELNEGRPDWCPLVDVGNCSEFPNNSTDCIRRQDVIDKLASIEPYAIDDEYTHGYMDGLRDGYDVILELPSVQPEQRYTEEELRVFQHGISLSLLSKRSSQYWRYDEDTATEIKFLERLYEKVGADMRGEQE